MRYYWIVLVLGCIFTPSFAATWTVEKDGSGDFTIIQEAIDAAADGDTVRVGSGRYADFRPYETLFNGTAIQVIAMIRKELSILGSGSGTTLIGPASFTRELDGTSAGGIFVDIGGGGIVTGLTIGGVPSPVGVVAKVALEECTFDARERGTATGGMLTVATADDVRLSSCEFLGPGTALSVVGDGEERLNVLGCTFVGSEPARRGIVIRGRASEVRIDGCRFERVSAGVIVSGEATVRVSDCEILPKAIGVGIEVEGGSCSVSRTLVGPTSSPVECVTGGELTVRDSVIGPGIAPNGDGTTTLFATSAVSIANSNLVNGGGLTVDGPNVPGRPVDVRNNWWGPTDLALIESWIKDDNGEVQYLPILEAPVSAPVESMGSIKSRIRGAEN